jgi:hypothetical protein
MALHTLSILLRAYTSWVFKLLLNFAQCKHGAIIGFQKKYMTIAMPFFIYQHPQDLFVIGKHDNTYYK